MPNHFTTKLFTGGANPIDVSIKLLFQLHSSSQLQKPFPALSSFSLVAELADKI